MFRLFLDPDKPLHTCKNETCDLCDVKDHLVCHFDIISLIKFLLMAFPPFIIAGISIFQFKTIFFLPWIAIILAYFGFIEIRVVCSHCPHYAEPSTLTLKCWANYGSPKLWKYRPKLMSVSEKIVFFLGLVVLFLYPVPFFYLTKNYILFGVFVVFIILEKWALNRFFCTRCINFACPLNTVDNTIRQKFRDKNPGQCPKLL